MSKFIQSVRKRLSLSTSGYAAEQHPTERLSLQDIHETTNEFEDRRVLSYDCYYLGSRPVYYEDVADLDVDQQEYNRIFASNMDKLTKIVKKLVEEAQKNGKSKLKQISVTVSQSNGVKFPRFSEEGEYLNTETTYPLEKVSLVSAKFPQCDDKNFYGSVAVIVVKSTSRQGFRCYAFMFSKFGKARSFCQFIGRLFNLKIQASKDLDELNFNNQKETIRALSKLSMGICNPCLEDDSVESTSTSTAEKSRKTSLPASSSTERPSTPALSHRSIPIIQRPSSKSSAKSLPPHLMSPPDDFFAASCSRTRDTDSCSSSASSPGNEGVFNAINSQGDLDHTGRGKMLTSHDKSKLRDSFECNSNFLIDIN